MQMSSCGVSGPSCLQLQMRSEGSVPASQTETLLCPTELGQLVLSAAHGQTGLVGEVCGWVNQLQLTGTYLLTAGQKFTLLVQPLL